MRHFLKNTRNQRLRMLPLAAALAVLLSACIQTSDTAPGDAGMSMKKVQMAEQADKKAHKKEEKEFKKEKAEEKAEDKDYAAMKKELEKDRAEAAAHPGQDKRASKLFVDTEFLAVNERVHHLSERMEELSQRVHELAVRLEHTPAKIADLELALEKTAEKLGIISARPTASGKSGKKANAPKQLTAAPKKSFWGIQMGAYRTRAGAEVSWAEFLAIPLAVELTEATVHYIAAKPNKKGHVFTLIVVNEYPNRKSANKACNALKENGLDCVAYRVKH